MEFICEECGKVKNRPPAHMNNHNFCDRDCYHRWQMRQIILAEHREQEKTFFMRVKERFAFKR